MDEEFNVKLIIVKIRNICKSGVSCYLSNQIITPSQIMQTMDIVQADCYINYFYINVLLLLLKELLEHFLNNWEQTTYSIRFVCCLAT